MSDNKPLRTTHKAGELAYLDTMAGLVSCRVRKVIESGNGRQTGVGKVEVIVLSTLSGYQKDEVLIEPTWKVVPKSKLKTDSGQYRVSVLYTWE